MAYHKVLNGSIMLKYLHIDIWHVALLLQFYKRPAFVSFNIRDTAKTGITATQMQ